MTFSISVIVMLASFISIFGTLLGAAIGVVFRNPSKRILSNVIGFAAGLMLSIVVFDLIPESIEWSFIGTIIFSVIGVLVLVLIDFAIEGQKSNYNLHKKVALLVAIGLMLHNFPEGVIMGCGFFAGDNLGIKMAIIIAIHDIPEGISFAAPLMAAKMRRRKILIFALITALPTTLGALGGAFVGNVSKNSLGACIAVASGVMLYVVCCEMIPESTNLWKGPSKNIATIAGFILGLVIINIF